MSDQPHYARFEIQPLEFCARNRLDTFQSNIIKYVCRYDAKGADKDLAKAMDLLARYRAFLSGRADWMDARVGDYA